MPIPFRPAAAAARARGLRVVPGEASAKARAAALRKSAGARAQPASVELDVYGPEEYERTVFRDPALAFSPRATAVQTMKAEALRRHAGKPDFDPASLADDTGDWKGYTPEAKEHELATRGQRMTPEEFVSKWRGIMERTGAKEGRPKVKSERGTRVDPFEVMNRQRNIMRRYDRVSDAELVRAYENHYGSPPQSAEWAREVLSPADWSILFPDL